jgi:hypothetical protein
MQEYTAQMMKVMRVNGNRGERTRRTSTKRTTSTECGRNTYYMRNSDLENAIFVDVEQGIIL